MNVPLISRYVSITSAVLAGWNVGLLAAFLVAIALAVGLGKFMKIIPGGAVFFGIVTISIVLGALLGVIVGRKVLPWLARKRPAVAYVMLAALALLSIASFPAIFSYGLSQ